MIKTTQRILILSHDATRTGAPILLLNLARLLKDSNYTVDFLLKGSGPLQADFENIGTTYFAFRKHSNSFAGKLKHRFITNGYNLKSIAWNSYDFILSNTITNGDILPEIKKHYDGPILSYIHELQMGTAFFTSEQKLDKLLKTSDGFLAPSESVKRHLMTNLKIKESKIAYLPYFIPSNSYPAKNEEVNLFKKPFTVGSVGTIDWRKSPEIFILIADAVIKKRGDLNILFKWQGAIKGVELDRLNYDITNLGLEEKVVFSQASSNVGEFYQDIDLFLLTSREDPYPLVVLEAANMSVPSICFERSGGAVEFIEKSKGGRVVPYLDIDAAATQIINFCLDMESQIETGKNAKTYLVNSHQDSEFVKMNFEKAVQKLLSEHAKSN